MKIMLNLEHMITEHLRRLTVAYVKNDRHGKLYHCPKVPYQYD